MQKILFFLLNALLHANGIKYINKIVYCYTHGRNSEDDSSMSNINSKEVLMGLVDAFFKMYILALDNNKSEIFKHYLLF